MALATPFRASSDDRGRLDECQCSHHEPVLFRLRPCNSLTVRKQRFPRFSSNPLCLYAVGCSAGHGYPLLHSMAELVPRLTRQGARHCHGRPGPLIQRANVITKPSRPSHPTFGLVRLLATSIARMAAYAPAESAARALTDPSSASHPHRR